MSSPTTGAPALGTDRRGPSARERQNLIDQITSASVASDYAGVTEQVPAPSMVTVLPVIAQTAGVVVA